jgi:hypothetical protein
MDTMKNTIDSQPTGLANVEALAAMEQPIDADLRSLEGIVSGDEPPEVRQAALAALALPAYRQLYRAQNQWSSTMRQTIAAEIAGWAGEGLIPEETAELLRGRYLFDEPAAETAAQTAKAAEPRPTLTQVLLSETAIKVALYLGAFFVIAAAFILAAVVESFRLPILTITTLLFLGAAVGLKQRLPQASFVLFLVFSFMIPIDGGVLADQLNLNDDNTRFFWVVMCGLLTVVWIGGTLFYRSRVFSLAALAAAGLGAFLFGDWLDTNLSVTLLLSGLVTLAGLGGAWLLTRWQNRTFALPVLLLAQLMQLAILGGSALWLLFLWFEGDWPAAGWWPLISFIWLLAALFYLGSRQLARWPVFPPLAVGALLPVPLLFSGLFSPEWQTVMMLAWGWGALLTIAGELWRYAIMRRPLIAPYGLWLTLGGAGLFATAALGGLDESVGYALAYLAGATVVYGAATLHWGRPFSWSATLAAGTLAWFAVFGLEWVTAYNFFPGYIFLWPLLALLSIHLINRRTLRAGQQWHLPPLLLGGVVGALLGLALLVTGFETPGKVALVGVGLSAYAALFGLLDRRPLIGFATTTGLAISLFYALAWREWEPEAWLWPYVGLALLYYVAGAGPAWLGYAGGWARVFRWSGLGLAVVVSLTAPLAGGAAGIIGTALLATCYTVEAFRQRNVWLAVPADLIYMISYFTLLLELEVTQPQFYSVGAALLGFIMHYLLVRSGSNVGAFIAGTLSQVVLQGTTYIQMVANDSLLYFFVLFFQAMVVLGYGLVVRSRSLVLAPIGFVVLGVISVALGVLAGVPALLLVGCSGLLLLLAGIAALLQRERLLQMTNRLGEQMGGWQA